MIMKKFVVFLCIAALLCGCSASVSETTAPETTVPVTTQATVPAEMETQWDDNIHSGLRPDGTFSAGTLFIGDSLTYGLVKSYLQEYGMLGEAKYMAVVGAPLGRFFSGQTLGSDSSSAYTDSFFGLSYSQAVAQVGESATAIYMMLGTNYNADTDTEHYIEVVDYLLETCPNATVFLQKIPICGNEAVDVSGVNVSLEETVDHYAAQGVSRVMVIDTFTAIGLSQGYDGIHLNSEGMDAWYLAIMANARNHNLPE